MMPDWRRMLPWGREAPDASQAPQEKKEPTLPRDENVGRMEFLLSLRRRGISDAAVLRAIDAVPREQFMLPEFAGIAYADQAMPIACGQTISQPYVVAYMTEQLDVKRQHRVLEVGTGSGYQAAILSQLAGQVFTVERYRTLAEGARKALAGIGADNVTVLAGDGLNGLPEHAPYDRIIVTAAAESIPEKLVEELAEGGLMVLPLGQHSGPQRLVKLTKGKDGVSQEDLIGVRFVPLLPGQAREL
jgi:protein-L-isoaspartate(D-aspartate) O-methyltransferase